MRLRTLIGVGFVIVVALATISLAGASPENSPNEQALAPPTNSAAAELAEMDKTAQSHFSRGDYAGAQRLWESYLLKSEKELGPEQPTIVAALSGLGFCYEASGKPDKALPLYQRALAIGESTLGKNHPDLASSLGLLAGLHQVRGEYEEALALYERSLSIVEKAFGPDGRQVVEGLLNLAALHRELGNHSQALASFAPARASNQRSELCPR
jgi:tetratricopeptide (TPR) repeat protein